MGWCSGTYVFDAVMDAVFNKELHTEESLVNFVKYIVNELEDMDWDCQQDSDFWNHPIVQQAFRELHPHWFEEE